MEIVNLPEKEFRIMIVKMVHDLMKGLKAKIEKMQEMFIKDLEELSKKQTEMNNTLEGINSRITEAEEWINDLEHRMVEITATEQNIEKRMKRNQDSLRDLWDNMKCSNIHIIWVPEGEQRERTWENIWRDNSWKLGQASPGNTESPRKDKPKEEHSNQTDRN